MERILKDISVHINFIVLSKTKSEQKKKKVCFFFFLFADEKTQIIALNI